MSRAHVTLLALFASTVARAEPPPKASRAGKSTICHVPPGNPAAAHNIVVAPPAVQAHLDHGDHVGSCTADTTVVDGSPTAASERDAPKRGAQPKKRRKKRKKRKKASK